MLYRKYRVFLHNLRSSVGSGAALSAILTVTSALMLIIFMIVSKGKVKII